jgi:glutathione S-transferase
MSATITLYSFVPFDRSSRVRWLAHELGLQVDERRLDYAGGEHRGDSHLARHPFGQVPAVEMDGQTRWESVAICQSLVEEHPDCGLAAAAGDVQRADYLAWLFFAASTFDSATFRVFKFTSLQPDPARRDEAVAELQPLLLRLARHLQEHDFLLGDRFSLPDLVLGHGMQLLYLVRLLDETPALLAYRERLAARPAAQQAKMFRARPGG